MVRNWTLYETLGRVSKYHGSEWIGLSGSRRYWILQNIQIEMTNIPASGRPTQLGLMPHHVNELRAVFPN
jgi:hypothetical protein